MPESAIVPLFRLMISSLVVVASFNGRQIKTQSGHIFCTSNGTQFNISQRPEGISAFVQGSAIPYLDASE